MIDQTELEARSNLTPTQFRIWMGQKLAPRSLMYSMAWRFDLAAEIDPVLFRSAFESLPPRIDALRLVVDEDADGVPRQRVLDGPAGALKEDTVVDPAAWIADRLSRPFDLARESFDAALLRGPAGWTVFLNQHHIATDATSGRIILEALDAAYRALAAGEAPEILPLPAFIDHAGAISRSGEAAVLRATREAAAPPPPRLYGRPEVGAGPAAARIEVPLNRARVRAFTALAETEGFEALTSAQARLHILLTLQAAWMARVSGRRHVSIGVMIHGRRTPEEQRTVGAFFELLPVNLKIGDGETFRSLHAKAAEATFEALRTAIRGDAGGTGFNAVLNVIPVAFESFAGAPIRAEWLHAGENDPQHVVRLSLTELAGTDAPALHLDLNRTVFDATVAERAPGHLLRLMDAMTADPGAAIDLVPLAGPEEASTALIAGTAESSAPPDVVAAFRARMVEAPEAPAVRDDGIVLTRQALDARSEAVAAALADLPPGARVGVYLPRSADLVAALLGVLKAGCTYVPLDLLQPTKRLERIVGLASLSRILSVRGMAALGAPTLTLDDLPAAASPPVHAAENGTPAYVLFTSGSTGTPKGVQVGRQALSRYAHWAANTFAAGPAEWALHSATGFDLTVTSIFAPLVSGGVVVAYREEGEPDLSVLRAFREDVVDVVKLSPAHLSLVLAEGRSVSRIHTLVVGGEDLSTALARRAREVLGDHVDIINEYGPTEATVGCMTHRFDPEADAVRPSVPIGRPAADTSIYVLDEGGAPTPDGAPGELYVAGPDRLADGYADEPEATACAFPPDPFHPGRRMYRTGDLASVDPDGTILFHGRVDAQLNLRGVRIEPAEIATEALAHPSVTACAVGLELRTKDRCRRCGLDAAHPDAALDDAGICALCHSYDAVKERAAAYFGDLEDLRTILARAEDRRKGRFTCVLLLSGGKDSTYALARMAELTPNILAATLDNGFIAEGAKANIRQVCARLGIEHRFMSTPAMNEIFADSLERYANVCNGCFKTIYTLGLRLAREEEAPLVVTGLSRGQLFETRLAPELFESSRMDLAAIDHGVLEARKAYHRFPDVAARRLNGDLFDGDRIFEEIKIVDFYRYHDVAVAEVYAYLEAKIGWERPVDTGRSTNCLINDVGIHVHKTRLGWHNYALPYSWDVRMGHKTREEALAELDDEIDEARVARILEEVGHRPGPALPEEGRLVCHYVSSDELEPQTLRHHLMARLPRAMVPIPVRVQAMPLTPNGKIDRARLPPAPHLRDTALRPSAPPRTETEQRLATIWAEVLRLDRVGVEDDFHELGGDSLAAIRIAARTEDAGLSVTAADLFRARTVARLATIAGVVPLARDPVTARAELDDGAKARLSALFGTRDD